MKHTKSKALFEEANKYIPGGVNSPVRAFKSVGIDPIFIEKAHGSIIEDVDGNQYIDYICSWGPLILGHSNEMLMEGVVEAIARGTSYGVPTGIEVEMARLIVEAYKCIDQVRMVNSGTEATMSALRVARGYTGRNKILKFEGCYHGHSDALLVKSGSGTITYGVPTSPGVPADVVKDTLVARYNDVEGLREVFEANKNEIAAVIVEPIGGNMGVVPADKGFLEELRQLTLEAGTVLIFDEVITGFRIAYGSSQEYFGIQPDMVCFGKIIGGGLPVGAYGGKKTIMDMVSPVGPVYQAGTLSGNPLAMYMGKKQLEYLRDNPNVYTELEEKATYLEAGIKASLEKLGLNYTVNRAGSLVCLFFTESKVTNFEEAMTCNVDTFNRYFKALLDQGILIGPAQYEAMFLSTAHTKEQLDTTLIAIHNALKQAHDMA
ncbi:MAG: glutamate-1-semialdehyde 2,1-aminomutase [Cellulosilyticaceae bacterium]